MALNPLTGQFEDQMNPDANESLAMRMMGAAPGITASLGMSSRRGANTLMRGGYFDDRAIMLGSRENYQIFQKGSRTPTKATRKSFLFGSRRFADDAAAAGSGKAAFAKTSRLNNAFYRPRNLSRFHSLSVFGAAEGSSLYTYAQGNKIFGKTQKFGMGRLRDAAGVGAGEAALGPGLFAAVSAGRRMDLRGIGNMDDFAMRIERLATMNNPALMRGTAGITYSQASAMTRAARGGLDVSAYMAANAGTASTYASGMAAVSAGEKGVAGNLLASSMGGKGTQYLGGYFRGALGFSQSAGLMGASEAGAKMAVSHLSTSFGTGIVGRGGITYAGEAAAQRVLSQGVYNTLGSGGIAKALGTSAGAKVLGARAAAMAIPGLQFVAAASFVYDLGKMAGEVVKSGINLARDANKSLQGSINKPMFGMGYRDTEAAATSRSRGVMAIQNSRLNARSVLGSEAGMMASHFG
jgi:hypothetical protein